MSPNIYIASLLIPAVSAVLIFMFKFLSQATQAQAQSRMGLDAAYRGVAEKATAAQMETAAALAEVQARLIAIEKILKEVE